MKVIIDRFEGSFAVCEKEDGNMININRDELPAGSKEGHVINIEGDSITIDQLETEKRKEQIERLSKELWAD